MERRVLVAIFLSFIVLYAYQAFIVKPTPKPAAGSAPTSAAARTPSPTAAATTPAPQAPAVVAAPAAAVVGESTERDVRIETRDVIAVFTNRGARLKSWRL